MSMQPIGKAYNWLRKHQWVQNKMFLWKNTEAIGACLIGAVNIAYRGTGGATEARLKLEAVCLEKYGNSRIPVVNDRLISTKREALFLLRKAQI